MDKLKILITGVGAPGAPSIIKCLRNNNEREIYLVGVDINEKASCRKLVDSFYVVPKGDDPKFIDSIMDICIKENVQIIIPLVTKELYAFSYNRDYFLNKCIQVSVMEFERLKIVNNKGKLLSKLNELSIDTPDFIICNSVSEIESGIIKMGYPNRPVCVKTVEGNGSRGVRIVDASKSRADLLFNEKPNTLYIGYNELMDTFREATVLPEIMVMEYLPGEEYGVDALCKQGSVLYISGRVNESVNSSIPQASIIKYKKYPIEVASKIINKLKLSGNINFDFKYDSKGEAKLIEINPRLSATIMSYIAAGINYPYLQVKNLLSEDLPKINIQEGGMMQRRYTEVLFNSEGNEIEW